MGEEPDANINRSEQSKDGLSVRNSEGSISESGLLTIYESCFGFSIVNEADQTKKEGTQKGFKSSKLSQSLDRQSKTDLT